MSCKGTVEVHVTKPSANVGVAASESDREAKASNSESCRTTDSSMDSRIEEIFIIVKEIRDEMVGKQLESHCGSRGGKSGQSKTGGDKYSQKRNV